ncbi:MAG: DNA-processing protein DprA [Bacteroidota bacterium]
MESSLLHLLVLSQINGLGPVSTRRLLARFGGADKLFAATRGKLLQTPGVGPKVVDQLISPREYFQKAEQELQFCEQNGIVPLPYTSPDYPRELGFLYDAPLLVFKKGAVDLNLQPGIAIVGTRKATEYGKELAAEFAACFSRAGMNVVSGLAYGIDIAAHKSAVETGGITTAVLGHGLDTIYPARHRKKAEEVLERGGWVTEFLSGTLPERTNFPARNRIISGLSKAVLVIEAAAKGGALITARMAFDQNREVFAVPGRLNDPVSVGCNHLIRDQVAKLVTTPEEILEELEIAWQQPPNQELATLALPLNAEETRVLQVLSKGEALVDQLAIRTSIPVHQLSALLLSMEFRGLLKQLPGKRFRKL